MNNNITFSPDSWADYLYWQTEDRKTLKRINQLLADIQRNSYSQSRAFLGWSDTVEGGNSTDFSSAFFPEVIAGNHSNNIRDAAVWAADQVPGYHTAPIKFIGDRTYRGFV